jgi:small GTP-binding protein
VVDARVGATDEDEAVANVLRRSGKPVVLAANKVDDARSEADATSLWSLGLGEPVMISAMHGRGAGDLLDLVLDALPEAPPEREEEAGPRRVALIGRPNVGKSSLLNKLAGEQRAVVDPVAGTTRDPVDELIELGGITWRFVDTAGIRRRFRESQGADYYATLRTAGALDRAEVAVVLVDASDPLTEQDLRIITMVIEAGRALVIAFNKWDLTDEERRHYLEREIERQLNQARWAQPVPEPGRRRHPAADARRTPAADPVRHPGGHQAAALRAVHHRVPRGDVPQVHRTPAEGGVRLRGHPDQGDHAGAREARQGRGQVSQARRQAGIGGREPAACVRDNPFHAHHGEAA